MWTQLSYIR